jgi:hypothetical protein
VCNSGERVKQSDSPRREGCVPARVTDQMHEQVTHGCTLALR